MTINRSIASYLEILWSRRWLWYKIKILLFRLEDVGQQIAFFRSLNNLNLDSGLLGKLVQDGHATDACELRTNVSGAVKVEEGHEDVIQIGLEAASQVNWAHVLVHLNHCGLQERI